jgi:hypothetical protein
MDLSIEWTGAKRPVPTIHVFQSTLVDVEKKFCPATLVLLRMLLTGHFSNERSTTTRICWLGVSQKGTLHIMDIPAVVIADTQRKNGNPPSDTKFKMALIKAAMRSPRSSATLS